MDKIKELDNNFKANYHGVLTHDGWLKVAKSNITAKILNIQKNNVQVKGNNRSYICEIHKDLYPVMDFVNVGDTALIKFRNGKAWFIGFRKKNYDNKPVEPTGDNAVSENMDWISFFKQIDGE